MWFPVGAKTDNSMIPQSRNSLMPADQIVQEYLQMKSLLSYVGDLILPYNNNPLVEVEEQIIDGESVYQRKFDRYHHKTHNKPDKNSFITKVDGGVSKRVAGVVSTDTYADAMREAVTIWTPLLGTCHAVLVLFSCYFDVILSYRKE